MEHRVKVEINIEETPISTFSKFNLNQSFNEHHTFELRFNQDQIEQPGALSLKRSKDFIGKNLTIEFGNIPGLENRFSGIITKVEIAQSHGFMGDIIISGFSPTILIDRGPDLGSYLGKDLKSIISQVTKDVPANDLYFKINPNRKTPIDYLIQYKESDFEFITRLSAQYHEWFFYNGTCLIFGKPDDLKEVKLTYGRDLNNIQYGMQIAPLKYKKFTYSAKQDELFSANGEGQNSKFPDMLHVIAASNSVYNKTYNQPLITRADSKMEVDSFVKNEQESVMSGLVHIHCEGDNPQVAIGSIVDISMSIRNLNDFSTEDFGKFLVTSVSHKIDGVGRYGNTFQAIPADTERVPVSKIQKPQPDMQLADVISNNDPNSHGRIKVKFKWACNNNDTTEWLRVLTPDAGQSEKVSKNRGVVFIPEVGDQVIVGFEEGNIAKPFVLGSVYHGKNTVGGNSENHLKTISTRSGNVIRLNDAEGSIYLEDPSGNTVYMDGQGNIAINSPNKITLNAKDIELNSSHNLAINVGNSMITNVSNQSIMNVLQKMMVNTPFLTQLVSEMYHTQAGKALINSENEIKLESPEMYVAGQRKLFLHSDEKATINSKGMVEMKGENGNKHSNKPIKYKKVPVFIDQRCLVTFRPKDNWNGNGYGFDWVRVGDTKIKGDTYYKNMIGSYGTVYASLGGVFTQSNEAFRKLMAKFNPHVFVKIDNKGKKNAITYCVPWLCLYPQAAMNTSASLRIIVNIEKEPLKLDLDYDKKLFKIIAPAFPLTKGKHEIELTVTCIDQFPKDQPIKVIATYKNATGEEEKSLAGKLNVLRNSIRYKLNVVFIQVATNINGSRRPKIGKPAGRGAELKKYLNQGLVNPVMETITLDMSTNARKGNFNTAMGVVSGQFPDGALDTIYQALNTELYKQYSGKKDYSKYMKVYFINENDTAGLYGIGRSMDNDTRTVLVYARGFADSTVSHETLHAMGLYHTFDNDSEFTFEINKTDNIMDYSDIPSNPVVIPVNTLYHWQWSRIWLKATKI